MKNLKFLKNIKVFFQIQRKSRFSWRVIKAIFFEWIYVVFGAIIDSDFVSFWKLNKLPGLYSPYIKFESIRLFDMTQGVSGSRSWPSQLSNYGNSYKNHIPIFLVLYYFSRFIFSTWIFFCEFLKLRKLFPNLRNFFLCVY